MGMFDSIMLDIICPFCGEESLMDCQTKELDCMLDVWKKGDVIKTDLDHLECIADCIQQSCKNYTIQRFGYWGGFGRSFLLDVKLENGRVTGEYKISNTEE
jgi:hypothetical protein